MSKKNGLEYETVKPGQGATLYGRAPYLDLSDNSDKDVTQILVTGPIQWTSKRMIDQATINFGTFSASDVIFDSLITRNGKQYNFRGYFPGSAWPTGFTEYQINVIIPLANGYTSECVFNVCSLGVI